MPIEVEPVPENLGLPPIALRLQELYLGEHLEDSRSWLSVPVLENLDAFSENPVCPDSRTKEEHESLFSSFLSTFHLEGRQPSFYRC